MNPLFGQRWEPAARVAQPRTRTGLSLLFILALPFASEAAAQSGCPAETLYCDGQYSYWTSPQGSCGNGPFEYVQASYNAAAGRLSASVSGSGGLAKVRVQDEFQVLGVTPGTTLPIKARLRLSLQSCGPSQACGCSWSTGALRAPDGTLNEVTLSADADPFHYCAYAQQTAEVAFSSITGQPFRVSYNLSLETVEGIGGITGQLEFADLPPGASIQSCYGFRQDFVVPAKRMSWGQIKLRYR